MIAVKLLSIFVKLSKVILEVDGICRVIKNGLWAVVGEA